MLSINSVLRPIPDCKTLFEGIVRVLAVKSNEAVLISLDVIPKGRLGPVSKKTHHFSIKAPFKVPLEELIEALKRGDLQEQVFETDIPTVKEKLSLAARSRLEENVRLIQPFMADDRMLFDSELRIRSFETRASETGASIRSIRRLYYRYLWGGQIESALVPCFHKNGGPGKPQQKGTARRGRRAIKTDKGSEVILPEVQEKLEKGARFFFLTGKYTLFESHVLTLKRYFAAGASLKNGKLKDILVPSAYQPSIWQFRYVCRNIELQEGKRAKLPRRLRPETTDAVLRGKARQGLEGPGHRFEIDATKLQIQLVSRYGRANLVGTPTLYLIMDIWSGACVGYALSLENASWALAARALHNCFQDKTEVFRRLNLPYTSEDWQCNHLCLKLAADRGELVSDKAGMVPEIGIVVEIMPPMCPTLKGKVEASIKDIKHGGFYYTPGSYPKFPKRREPDGKDTAALTLEELEQIIVNVILDYNNDPVPVEQIPHEMLRDDEPVVTHIGMYMWGLENRPGYTRKLTKKDVYSNLLTADEGSMTSRGISFKGQNYISDVLHEGNYLASAAMKGRYRIEIRYDEHIADQIWFLHNNEWVPAFNDNEQVNRLKCAFFELESFRIDAERLAEEAKAENIHHKDEKNNDIAKIAKAAEEMAKAARFGKNKTQNKGRIRVNRKIDCEADRLRLGEHTAASYVHAVDNARALQKFSEEPLNRSSSEKAQSNKTITALSKVLWED